MRRFEDLGNTGIKNIEIIETKPELYLNRILSIIAKLQKENTSLQPDDIGIMFLENDNRNYQLASNLQVAIGERFQWDVNIGYESKKKSKGSVFVSNKNNVKGLEFPFVICLMQSGLDRDLQNRNAIYMMLTRSFITSYFLIPDGDYEKIAEIKDGVDFVEKMVTFISRNQMMRKRKN